MTDEELAKRLCDIWLKTPGSDWLLLAQTARALLASAAVVERKVGLAAFCANLHRTVDAFEANWRAQRATDPTRCPLHMGEADWHEQFIMWMSSEDCEIAKR